jgi:transposase-like protein
MATEINSDARMMRGLELSKTATIAENEDGSFAVPSLTSGAVYQVKTLAGAWVCTCPDFENRADQIEMCKHAFAVKFWIAARVELEQAPKPKVFADDAVQCSCGSIRVVKFGHANGKQIFKCRDCGKKFREGLIKKARYSPETITLTLDLYFSGLSLRKITRMLNDHFDMNLAKSTVYFWIQKFVPKIGEYVDSLTPRLSETWQADELFVKMKNGVKDTQYNQKSMAYLWNVMDRKTRFLLASRISTHRNVNGAVGAFNAARKVAKDSQPEQIFADGLSAYPQAMAYWESESRPELVARMGVGKPHANNNRIERLNGTLRERVKVQRGWKSVKTPLAEGQRIQYNFVKPHMALEGQTPAQAANVGVNAKNKWLAMLTEAITRDWTEGEITR